MFCSGTRTIIGPSHSSHRTSTAAQAIPLTLSGSGTIFNFFVYLHYRLAVAPPSARRLVLEKTNVPGERLKCRSHGATKALRNHAQFRGVAAISLQSFAYLKEIGVSITQTDGGQLSPQS